MGRDGIRRRPIFEAEDARGFTVARAIVDLREGRYYARNQSNQDETGVEPKHSRIKWFKNVQERPRKTQSSHWDEDQGSVRSGLPAR
jgi:hypothetical protein